TSCGRILDAVSAILGICHERTYEGEPAMKLEAIASKGKEVLNLEPQFTEQVINTGNLVQLIFENVGRFRVEDLAYLAESYVSRSQAEFAVEKALENNVKTVGLSGGVAYNEHIATTIQQIVEKNGLNFVYHQRIPAGDGGTSFGQATVAGFKVFKAGTC
ncbi:MAG: carbamoyltransferase HypF, partial [Candidatus Bathyarchaeota archaeon]